MSNNLNIDQVVSTQSDKETTVNDANGQLDAAMTENLAKTIDNTNALTLTSDEFRRNFTHFYTDAGTPPTATSTVTVPAIKRGLFMVFNDLSTHSITVTIASQSKTAPTLTAGQRQLLHCDGSNVVGAAAAI